MQIVTSMQIENSACAMSSRGRVKFIHIARFFYDLIHGTKAGSLLSRLDQPRGLL